MEPIQENDSSNNKEYNQMALTSGQKRGTKKYEIFRKPKKNSKQTQNRSYHVSRGGIY
jgi:hypothetical protein